MTPEQMQADIDFLLARTMRAGSVSFGGSDQRDTGVSSNAIVRFAYTGEHNGKSWPLDKSDYAACVRAVRKLPRHRRTPEVMALLRQARTEAKAYWWKD